MAVGVGSPTTVTVPLAVVDATHKAATADLLECYDGSNDCDETYTVALSYTKDGAAGDPSAFMTPKNSNSEIDV